MELRKELISSRYEIIWTELNCNRIFILRILKFAFSRQVFVWRDHHVTNLKQIIMTFPFRFELLYFSESLSECFTNINLFCETLCHSAFHKLIWHLSKCMWYFVQSYSAPSMMLTNFINEFIQILIFRTFNHTS